MTVLFFRLVIGPALGGYFSRPASKYAFLDYELLRDYPYLLPMAAVSGLTLMATLLAYRDLSETFTAGSSTEPTTTSKRKASSLQIDQQSGTSTGSKAQPEAGCLGYSTPQLAAVLYAMISFPAIGADEIFNVWCATPAEFGAGEPRRK